MKKVPTILLLSSLFVLTMQIAHAEDDSYVDALSSEASGTKMKANTDIKPAKDDPEPPSDSDNSDALATKVTSQLETLLSGKSDKEVKTEDVADVVSSAVKEGHDIDAIQSAVSSAMDELKKKEGVEIKPEVFKFVANAVSDIVGASKDVAQGDPNDPYIQSLNAEVDDMSIDSDSDTKADTKTADSSSSDDKEVEAKTVEASSSDDKEADTKQADASDSKDKEAETVEAPSSDDTGDTKKPEETETANADASADTSGSGRTIIVLQGDSLSRIASKIYGSGRYYTVLFEANKDKISNPNVISVGQILTIPPLPASSE